MLSLPQSEPDGGPLPHLTYHTMGRIVEQQDLVDDIQAHTCTHLFPAVGLYLVIALP